MKLTQPVEFDPTQDLARIAREAEAWRSQFRASKVCYTPGHFRAELELLQRAQSFRLYLITRPAEPICLALIHPLDQDEVLELLAFTPLLGDDLVRPLDTSPSERRRLMRGAPAEPGGSGVFAFLLGEPQGISMLDLEPEGLVLVMARWGARNLLDPKALISQRMALLGEQIRRLASPEGD